MNESGEEEDEEEAGELQKCPDASRHDLAVVIVLQKFKAHLQATVVHDAKGRASEKMRLSSTTRNGAAEKIKFLRLRHPKWKLTELPWNERTLESEVALETGEQGLNKWNLMGRLGARPGPDHAICSLVRWMRPDMVDVNRPVYRCRFELQEVFFQPLGLLLDPATEGNYAFDVKLEDGRSEMFTYFGARLSERIPKRTSMMW
ncbi:hypothetical protein EJ110_NYTH18578 [Nymphaea thermarum]|nr:hypothetical protein EJ110_NYTH18578 [Nymphaea thermarum]